MGEGRLGGTKAHPLHWKAAVHAKVMRSRRYWKWHVRLGRLCAELGLETGHQRKED